MLIVFWDSEGPVTVDFQDAMSAAIFVLFMSNEELGEKPVPLPLIHQKSHMD
jgi:hypothetical protein